MKTPRRDFVVEYKSGRRQTKAQPTSIWGNLDLRAVARQVDADDASPKRHATPDQPGLNQSDITDVQTHAFNVQVDAVDDIAKELASSRAADDTTAPVRSLGTEIPADAISPSKVTVTAVTARKAHTPLPTVTSASSSWEAGEPEDELTAIEAENRQLKLLLVAKLRAENEWLASMLSRIEASAVMDTR